MMMRMVRDNQLGVITSLWRLFVGCAKFSRDVICGFRRSRKLMVCCYMVFRTSLPSTVQYVVVRSSSSSGAWRSGWFLSVHFIVAPNSAIADGKLL